MKLLLTALLFVQLLQPAAMIACESAMDHGSAPAVELQNDHDCHDAPVTPEPGGDTVCHAGSSCDGCVVGFTLTLIGTRDSAIESGHNYLLPGHSPLTPDHPSPLIRPPIS